MAFVFFQATDYNIVKADNYTFNLQWAGVDCRMDAYNFSVMLQEEKAYQIMLLGRYGNSDNQILLVSIYHFIELPFMLFYFIDFFSLCVCINVSCFYHL